MPNLFFQRGKDVVIVGVDPLAVVVEDEDAFDGVQRRGLKDVSSKDSSLANEILKKG
jgi:hypothetical protein